MSVRNVGWHPIWLTGGVLLPPGETREVASMDAPNEQGWLQAGCLKIV